MVDRSYARSCRNVAIALPPIVADETLIVSGAPSDLPVGTIIGIDCAQRAGAVWARSSGVPFEGRYPLTRKRARGLWAWSGMSLTDLTIELLEDLRERINHELRRDRPIKRLSIRSRPRLVDGPKDRCAYLRCSASYFKDREAVTFHQEGFVGFAGWADDTTVQPILRAFVSWLGSMPVKDGTSPGRH